MSLLGLDRERILALLGRLDDACVEAGIDAELFLVGGAAMALMYDVGRATRDLDGIFASSAELRAIIARLDAQEDLQPDWLNDAAKGFLPGNDPQAHDGYVGRALRVQVASPRYLLAMKLLSARPERDFDDALRLAEPASIGTHEELLGVLDEHNLPSAIPAKCRYFAGDVAQSLRSAAPPSALDGPWPGSRTLPRTASPVPPPQLSTTRTARSSLRNSSGTPTRGSRCSTTSNATRPWTPPRLSISSGPSVWLGSQGTLSWTEGVAWRLSALTG